MSSNEEVVRAAYHAAEGDVLDLRAWRDAFTDDGVFVNVAAAETYTGDRLGDVVTGMGAAFPDVHRELVGVDSWGDLVVVELRIQGTHRGALPTPAGDLAPTGHRIDVPTADVFRLRAGRIESFHCYLSMNIMLAQVGVYPDFAAAVAHDRVGA